MAKQGMKRPGSDETGHKIPKNTVSPVSEIQGKAKSGKKPAGEFHERRGNPGKG